MSRARISLIHHVVGTLAMAFGTFGASAQSTGNYANGQTLFTSTLSPQCSSCHSTTNAAAANSLTIIRGQITARATPAGGAGTMSFAKALEALNAALGGTSLGGAATGMNGFFTLSTTQKGDLAAFISNLTTPTPAVTTNPDFPQLGPVAVGAAAATMNIAVTNTGTADLIFAANGVASIATGPDSGDFTADGNDCATKTLRVGTADSCVVRVTFAPRAGTSSTRYGSLAITSNTSPATKLITLTGTISGSSTGTPTTPPTPAPSGSANAPSGGGGALPWTTLALLALGLVARRRR